jgi:hypothetical protein
MSTRLETLKNYINSLGDKWKPDGGSASIKKIWDANRKQFNLNFFAKYPYLVLIENESDEVEYLLDLESEGEAEAYAEYGAIGKCGWRILNLDTGLEFCRYIPPDAFGRSSNV